MRKNFRMFKRLCGEETFRNVVIVTNFWGEVGQEVGEARVRELCADEKFYKTILENGAIMVHHDNTAQSARSILQRIIKNYPLPLRIQKELVEEHKAIELTDAAVELNSDRAEKERQHLAEMRDIKQRMREAIAAKDEQMKVIVEEWKEEVEEKMKDIRREKERAAAMSAQYASELSTMEKRLKQYAASRAESKRKLKRLEKQLAQNQEHSIADRNAFVEQLRNLQQDSGGSFWGGFFGVLGVVGAAALALF